jgi:hypothetical protein
MTTITLAENPGNTTIPIITNIPYYPGFPEYDRGTIARACDWCRVLECTDPECARHLQEEEQCCQCVGYPLYSDFCCDCCGSYFENQEQLDAHNPQLCWDQQQLEQIHCTCCGSPFETQEQLNEHNPEQCYANNTTYECSCCRDYFYTHADFLAHDETKCWNEYELSRNGEYPDQELLDEYQDELEQERLADFREQCRQEMRAIMSQYSYKKK